MASNHWSHPAACAGRTRFVDLEPLRAAPCVRWTLQSLPRWPRVVAGPGAVVVDGVRAERLLVLDLETGLTRLVLPGSGLAPILVEGLVLRTHGRIVTAHDLETGTPRFEFTLRGAPWELAAVGTTLLVGQSSVIAARCVTPGGACAERLWRCDLAELKVGPGARRTLMACAELVVVHALRSMVALDPRTGGTLWSRPDVGDPVRVDASRVVTLPSIHCGRGGLLGRDGRESGGERGGGSVEVLAPDRIVALDKHPIQFRDEDCVTVRVVERSTGQERVVFDWYSISHPTIVMARDVVYIATDYNGLGVGAVTDTGAALWSFSDGLDGEELLGLVPVPRGLLVLTRTKLVCLGHADTTRRVDPR